MLSSHPSSIVPDVMLSHTAMPAAHYHSPSKQEDTENLSQEPLKQLSANAEAATSTANLFRPAKENEPPHRVDSLNRHQAEGDGKLQIESDQHRTRRETVV